MKKCVTKRKLKFEDYENFLGVNQRKNEIKYFIKSET